MYKNQAGQYVQFFAHFISTGKPATGIVFDFTPKVAKDGSATFTTLASSPIELSAANAKGVYQAALSQAETNADVLVFVGLTNNDDIAVSPVMVYTKAAVATDIAAIKAKTDNLPSDPADASVVAGLIAAVEAKVDIVDTVSDAIKAKTDALPSDPADASVIAAAFALTATIASVEGVGDAVANADGRIILIKAKTDALPANTATEFNEVDATLVNVLAAIDDIEGGGGGGGTIIRGPLVSSRLVANRTSSPITLEMHQSEIKVFDITVTDENDEAVTLTGMTLRFVVHDENEPPSAVFDVEAGASIVIASNVASVTVNDTQSANALRNHRWELWDVTAKAVLAGGSFGIKPAKFNHV